MENPSRRQKEAEEMRGQPWEGALQLEEEAKGEMGLQREPGGSVQALPWEGSKQERRVSPDSIQ